MDYPYNTNSYNNQWQIQPTVNPRTIHNWKTSHLTPMSSPMTMENQRKRTWPLTVENHMDSQNCSIPKTQNYFPDMPASNTSYQRYTYHPQLHTQHLDSKNNHLANSKHSKPYSTLLEQGSNLPTTQISSINQKVPSEIACRMYSSCNSTSSTAGKQISTSLKPPMPKSAKYSKASEVKDTWTTGINSELHKQWPSSMSQENSNINRTESDLGEEDPTTITLITTQTPTPITIPITIDSMEIPEAEEEANLSHLPTDSTETTNRIEGQVPPKKAPIQNKQNKDDISDSTARADPRITEKEYRKMEEADDKQSMDPTMDTTWSTNSIQNTTHPSTNGQQKSSDRSDSICQPRNQEIDHNRGNISDLRSTKSGVTHWGSTQEEQQIKNDCGFEIPELLHRSTQVQVRGPGNMCNNASSRGSPDDSGLNGRFSSCIDRGETPSIPGNSMEQQFLPIQRTAFWPGSFPLDIYQIGTPYHRTLEKERDPYIGLHGRLHINGQGSQSSSMDKTSISKNTTKTGLVHLRRQVRSPTITNKRVSWNANRHNKHSILQSSHKEIARNQARNIKINQNMYCQVHPSTSVSKNCWQMYSSNKGHHTNTHVSAQYVPSDQLCPYMEQFNSSQPHHDQGTSMVETINANLEWQDGSASSNRRNSGDRCFHDRMGRYVEESASRRSMGFGNAAKTEQYSRIDGSADGTIHIQTRAAKQNNSAEIRQYNNSSLHQQADGIQQRPTSDNSSYLQSVSTVSNDTTGTPPIRSQQYQCRFSEQDSGSLRLGTQLPNISSAGSNMGTTLNRSNGIMAEQEDSEIQLQDKRARSRGSGCIYPMLESGKQLHKSTIQIDTSNPSTHSEGQSESHTNSTSLASSVMVSSIDESDNRTTNADRSAELFSTRTITDHRTTEKSQMENCSLQDIWNKQLQEWPEQIREKIVEALKKSTKRSYDVFVHKFQKFCEGCHMEWQNATDKEIGRFLMEIAQDKDRPKSSLDQALASVAAMFEFSNKMTPTHSPIITRLRKGLINSTPKPIQRGGAIAPEPLKQLFVKMGTNMQLTVKDLRMKAMALVAFVGMFRPSDLALPTTDNIKFHENQSAVTFCLLGFKNDYNANGDSVVIPAASEVLVCPVAALFDYIQRTQEERKNQCTKVFIALKSPYEGLSADRCSNELKRCAILAGYDPELYTGRSFRRGGATTAINNNINMNVVAKVGRWKSTDVVMEHYVRARPNAGYTDQVMETTPQEE